VKEKHGADGLYSAVQCMMYANWTKDQEAQQDVALQMIQFVKP